MNDLEDKLDDIIGIPLHVEGSKVDYIIPRQERDVMRAEILRLYEAYCADRQVELLESLIKGQYVTSFTKHIQATANELKVKAGTLRNNSQKGRNGLN